MKFFSTYRNLVRLSSFIVFLQNRVTEVSSETRGLFPNGKLEISQQKVYICSQFNLYNVWENISEISKRSVIFYSHVDRVLFCTPLRFCTFVQVLKRNDSTLLQIWIKQFSDSTYLFLCIFKIFFCHTCQSVSVISIFSAMNLYGTFF